MKSRVDWSVLRGAFGALAICGLLAAIMVASSAWFRDEMISQYRDYQGRFTGVSRKYLAVEDQARVIRESFPRFVELHYKGIIGAEQRLNWLETLRRAGRKIMPPELTYQVESQAPFTPDFPVSTGAFEISASTMKLTMGLLHEGDFLELLDFLDAHALGLYTVSSCSFKRATDEVSFRVIEANIQADCDLRWLSVDLSGDRTVVIP